MSLGFNLVDLLLPLVLLGLVYLITSKFVLVKTGINELSSTTDITEGDTKDSDDHSTRVSFFLFLFQN